MKQAEATTVQPRDIPVIDAKSLPGAKESKQDIKPTSPELFNIDDELLDLSPLPQSPSLSKLPINDKLREQAVQTDPLPVQQATEKKPVAAEASMAITQNKSIV